MDSFLGHELPVVPVYKTRHVQSDTPNQMTELTKAAMIAKYGKEEYDRVMADVTVEVSFRARRPDSYVLLTSFFPPSLSSTSVIFPTPCYSLSTICPCPIHMLPVCLFLTSD